MKYVLILEDNVNELAALEKVVREISNEIKVFTVQTYEKACAIALTYQIDVFVLDIVLEKNQPGDASGMKFAWQIRKYENYIFTPIIFTTELDDPKYHAYREIHCCGYLEKPFSMQEAKKVIAEALKFSAPVGEGKMLYLKKDGILYAVPFQKVIYAEVHNHILYIHTRTDVLKFPHMTIKKFLDEARGQGFYQCSRNTVVNTRYLEKIDPVNKYIALTVSEDLIELGPSFCRKFIKEIKDGD